jgi:hypothetical protein
MVDKGRSSDLRRLAAEYQASREQLNAARVEKLHGCPPQEWAAETLQSLDDYLGLDLNCRGHELDQSNKVILEWLEETLAVIESAVKQQKTQDFIDHLKAATQKALFAAEVSELENDPCLRGDLGLDW